MGEPGVKLSDRSSYLGLTSVDELAALSRIVVRGPVTTIGRPHFNSSDGGFWHPALHDEPGVVDVAAELFRDVTIRADEVWGTTDPAVVRGSALTFRVHGGQVLVNLGPEAINSLELTPQSAYVFSSPPEVDLTIGEQAVFFLPYEAIDGLYDGRYGSVGKLVATHELAYMFAIEGALAVNAYRPNFTMSVTQIKHVTSANLATRARPVPPSGFVPAQSHPTRD